MRCSLFIIVPFVLHVSASIQSPPRITKQPPTDELLFQVAQQSFKENDKPFVIQCEAEGEPAPKYRWIKNGKKFEWPAYDNRISQQPGRGTLMIKDARDEDLGQYQCFATNEWGTATSNSVFVRKAELNSFKDEDPKTLDVEEGAPFRMTCHPPDGWPKPNVYWFIQDAAGVFKPISNPRMTSDPEGNLWFSNVTRNDASDDFYYSCMANSLYRNEFKKGDRFILNVVSTGWSVNQYKHELVPQYVSRKNEVALRGKKIELYCIYGGTPLPSTVWFKNGKRLKASDRVTQGKYGKSLIIKTVNFNDEGNYTCEVSNGVGTIESHMINLKVQSIPYFTVEPKIIDAAEDETVEFHCEARGLPEPQIKWIWNGKPIAEAPPNSRRKISQNSIVIEKLEKSDTANYGCNATNSLGYVYKDVYVNVLAHEPKITQAPMDLATVNDKDVHLTCRVFGVPKPAVEWTRNGQELTGGRYKTLATGDLEIKNVGFLDSGNYTCHASNKFGSAKASATLLIKEHTKITHPPEDYEVATGTTATFRCNAVSDSSLPLTIDWFRNGQPIDTEVEPRFQKAVDDYSLLITKTTELDSGIYTCRAHTELDETTAQATLIVQDVPNAPELWATRCNSKTAEIHWSPVSDNRAPISRYTIQHNTSFTPDAWEISADNVPGTEQTYNVQMSPWANYTFRVVAWNSLGPSIASKHGSVCTTQPDVPYSNPDNVMGKGTDPRNIVISWTVMPQILHNAPKFMYRVAYKFDIPGEEWVEKDIHDWKVHRLQVDKQPTYQRYQIKVVAINEKGESSAAPKIVIGYSGEDQPTQAPNNFILIQVVSSTSAELSWNPVPESSVRGELQGYRIQTWTERDGEEGMREINVGNRTRAVVDKFVPYSKNYVRVLAFNGRYNGPPSEVLTFNTPEGKPGTILSLDAFPIGSSALWLEWTRPAEANGVLTGYRIYYQVVDGTSLGPLLERQPHIFNPEATSAKLPSLAPNTNHRIIVRATTRAGEGEEFYIEQRTRYSQKPDMPHFTWKTFPKENGYSNINVTWIPNLNGHPGVHFYAKYKLEAETIFRETDPEFLTNELEIRGLQSGEVYLVSIVAVDGNYLTESEPQEVETSSEGPIIQPKEHYASAGWFIAMMLGIVSSLVLLMIVCVIRRKVGGKKVAVHEREISAGRGDYPAESAIHEYSRPFNTNSAGSCTSLASSFDHDEKHSESKTDLMAEYGESNTGLRDVKNNRGYDRGWLFHRSIRSRRKSRENADDSERNDGNLRVRSSCTKISSI